MLSNLDRYKADLKRLLDTGHLLHLSIQRECLGKQVEKAINEAYGEGAPDLLKALPSFSDAYQSWYTEAKAVVKQLVPDRLADFVRHYEKPKGRKEISFENYRIEDCLQGLNVTRGGFDKVKVAGPDAAIPHFRQQLAILASIKKRFESSLFDIRQLVQADLFDSELDAAKELSKNGFTRAAGAVAGVVLERHLRQVCENHNVKLAKKDPTISVLNDAIKEAGIIEVPQWRFVQHLGDIRNLCDHSKKVEPTAEQVEDLIAGTMKIVKTMF